MCTCVLLGIHAQPGFCLGMGTEIFGSLLSIGHQISVSLNTTGTPAAALREARSCGWVMGAVLAV